jgi:hypothetical protein
MFTYVRRKFKELSLLPDELLLCIQDLKIVRNRFKFTAASTFRIAGAAGGVHDNGRRVGPRDHLL